MAEPSSAVRESTTLSSRPVQDGQRTPANLAPLDTGRRSSAGRRTMFGPLPERNRPRDGWASGPEAIERDALAGLERCAAGSLGELVDQRPDVALGLEVLGDGPHGVA